MTIFNALLALSILRGKSDIPLPPPSEIVSLYIYPIKSCRGIRLQSTVLTRRGLELDRQWMFVDAVARKFLTIREISRMTLVDTSLVPSEDGDKEEESLRISIRGTDKSISIPARPSKEWLAENTTLGPVKIWATDTDAFEYSPTLNSLFSDFFGRDVALVYKGPTPRILKGNGAPDPLGRTEATNFPDVLPIQVASEASLAELNARLKAKNHPPITVERFRPNIVIRGNTPWEEDAWRVIRINGSSTSTLPFFNTSALDLDVSARCARCQVPNVDPDTAEKDPHEPWDTLVSYRRVDEGIKFKPCFGMLCCPRNEGTVEVGMRLEVLQTTASHLYIKGF